MIFLNRRRSPNKIKNPSKYWYIEKYVYGVLKETVEIPLGTSTTFSSISSGNSSDTFYGWSISSTSTTRTFTNTTSYSNTTTNVKNNLDENNTLKIYAVYSYSTTESRSTIEGSSNSNNPKTLTVSEDSTAVFGGYIQHTSGFSGPSGANVNSSFSALALSASYAKINGSGVTGTVNTSQNNTTTVTESVRKGDIIWICGNYVDNSTGSSSGTNVDYTTHYVYCTVPHYVAVTKYRV